MTPEQFEEAKRYGRSELQCMLADKLLDLLFLTVMLVLASPLDQWLQQFALLESNWSLRLAAFFLLMTGLHIVVSSPLSFYAGFLLEHRFHLSTLSIGGWLWRYAKRNVLAITLGLVMILALYWLIWTTGPWWWIAAAVVFFLFSVLLGRLAPVLLLPLFYKIERLDAPELVERMARLAEGTGLSIEGVYRMDLSDETVKANAMLAGMGRTRRVLLGDTLLNGFTPDEIEVIFAHEIGHHVFRHIRKMILMGLVSSAAGFWVCDQLLTAGTGAFEYSLLPIASLPILMLTLTIFATVLEPLQNAISRHYERQCDRYALERTGRADAYIAAFEKLAKLNKDNPSPSRLSVILFHSHPPISERLAAAVQSPASPSTSPEETGPGR
jgi:STE24 endopeptidase